MFGTIGSARATPSVRTRTQLDARAAGVAILLFIYVEIFPVYRLDTSLLIFQMQILHLTIASIMQRYLLASSAYTLYFDLEHAYLHIAFLYFFFYFFYVMFVFIFVLWFYSTILFRVDIMYSRQATGA